MKMLKKIFLGACIFGLIGVLGINVDAKAATEVTVDTVNDKAVATWDNSTLSANKVVYYLGSASAATKLAEVSVSGVSSNEITDLKTKVLAINSAATADTITGNNVVVEVYGNSTDTATSSTKTADLYKLTASVAATSAGRGTVAIDGVIASDSKSIYDYAGKTHTITATGSEIGSTPYAFAKWTLAGNTTDLGYSYNQTVTVSATTTSNKYEAHFDKTVATVTLKAANSSSSSTSKLTVSKGDTVTFSASLTPSGAKYSSVTLDVACDPSDDEDCLEEISSTKYKAVAKGTAYAMVTVTTTDGRTIESNEVEIKVTAASGTFSIAPSSGNYYVTKDYPIELKATNASGTVTWTNSSSSISGSFSSSTGATVTFTPSTTGTLKITATDSNGGSATMSDITVYDKPTLTYSSRALSYTAPAKVYTGTTSGVDSSNTDYTLDSVDSVSGVKLQVFFDGNSLGTTSTAKSSGTSATISASTVETLILNLKSSFSKSGTVTFRAYPCNSDGKYNKNIYAEATAQLYKISVAGTGITADNFYGLSGQSLSITAKPTSGTWAGYWEDDKTITSATRTVTVDGEKTYTAVLDGVAASKTSANGEAYDSVPKTGENNSGVLGLIAILILGAAAGGYYFYKFLGKKSF